MDNELQDAIERIDAWEVRPDQIPHANLTTLLMFDLGIAVKAARKYANPDIEAGAKAAYEHVHGGERWEDAEPLDRERFIGEATVTIDAALGVTKNELARTCDED